MSAQLKPLTRQVMVITGASSGIGLATAYEAARQGTKVMLAARSRDDLAEAVRHIKDAGGQAAYVVADVSKRGDVQNIADTAVDEFGRIDTWVNDAGGSIFGRLEEVSDEDSRQLFETNFWGTVYGSLIAVKHLKRDGGALINLGSVASELSFPLQGMYCATKHAVKAFTDALRLELEEAGDPISVTLIKPTAINTPFPQHARNYMDREPKLPPPIYATEEVVRAILHAATHQVRDIYVGGAARAMTALGHQMPRSMDYVAESTMFDQQKRKDSPRNPSGALYRAGGGGRIEGDHPGHVMKTSLYTRGVINPVLSTALMAAAGIGLLSWLSSSTNS